MATSVLDLINADRFDSVKVTMNDPVANYPMNCTVNTIPTGAKDCRDFLPTDTFSPSRQEDPIRLGLRVFAASPRHLLHDNSTGRTVDSPQVEHIQTDAFSADRNQDVFYDKPSK